MCFKTLVFGLFFWTSSFGLASYDSEEHFFNLSEPGLWQHSIKLTGEWQFFPGVDPNVAKHQTSDEFFKLPGYWKYGSKKLGQNWASWKTRVKVPKGMTQFVLKTPSVHADMKIFVDDTLIVEKGHVYRKGELAYFSFTPKSHDFTITMGIRNPQIRWMGPFSAIELGTPAVFLSNERRLTSMDMFLISAFIIIGLYHFVLFALRRNQKSTLWLAIFCIILAIRTSVTSSATLALEFFPGISIAAWKEIEYISMFVGCYIMIQFVHSIYPKSLHPWFVKGIGAIMSILVALTILTPAQFSSHLIPIVQLTAVIASFYALVGIALEIKRGSQGAKLFLFGMSIFVAGAMYDIYVVRSSGAIAIQGSAVAIYLFIGIQAIIIATRFNLDFTNLGIAERRIAKLNEDLQIEHDRVIKLNESLEEKVWEQTRHIKNMMEHINIGLLSFSENFSIMPDYSKYTETIISQKNLTKQNFFNLFFEASDLSMDRKNEVKNSFYSCLGMDALGYEVNSDKFPSELNLKDKVLEMDWSPIVDKNDIISNILVSIKDVTQLRILKKEAKLKEAEMKLVFSIVKTDSDKFNRYIRSSTKLLMENKRITKNLDHVTPEDFKILFINMHTVKGNSRIFGFSDISNLAHQIEAYYHDTINNNVTWDKNKNLSDLVELENKIMEYARIDSEVIGRGKEGTTNLSEIKIGFDDVEDQFVTLKKDLSDRTPDIFQTKYYNFLKQLIFKPALIIFEEIFSSVDRIARDLNKPTPTIAIGVDGILLHRNSEELLNNVFMHLLRNSMDHGLEFPTERELVGKIRVGHLDLKYHADKKLALIFSDDGRGLNLKSILEAAKIKGLVDEFAAPPPLEIANLIFNPGFSTAGEVTMISGRGVGMDSIRNFLNEIGGDITLNLTGDYNDGFVSFETIITLPESYFLMDSLHKVSQGGPQNSNPSSKFPNSA